MFFPPGVPGPGVRQCPLGHGAYAGISCPMCEQSSLTQRLSGRTRHSSSTGYKRRVPVYKCACGARVYAPPREHISTCKSCNRQVTRCSCGELMPLPPRETVHECQCGAAYLPCDCGKPLAFATAPMHVTCNTCSSSWLRCDCGRFPFRCGTVAEVMCDACDTNWEV